MKKRVVSIIALGALAITLAGCYEVPVTGRHAMNLVDSKEVTKMSVAAFEELKARNPRSRDKQRIEQLNRVGDRLSQVVFWDMPDADWEFVVFEVPNQINAFAMAGGKVGVFSGLYKIIQNDDQLASVIAHEIAHVTAKHVDERLSRELAMNTLGIAGGAAMIGTGANPLVGAMVLNAYGVGSDPLAFDRDKEKEADYIGLMYMARAGYDPQEAVKVLERLDAESSAQPAQPAILSTHPSNPERIVRLIEAMPKALEVQAQSGRKAAPVIVK